MSYVQTYLLEQRPENSVKKTNSDLNTWKRYLKGLKEEREIEFIPSEELNLLMCRFFMDAKKKDGGPYEPSTFTSFQRSLQRYLKDKGSKLNMLKDKEFSKSREVLLAKEKQLVEESDKGNRPRATREITEVGTVSVSSRTPLQKMRFFCGPGREAPKPAMERAQEPSIQQLKQQVMSVVLSSITSLLRAIGLRKC